MGELTYKTIDPTTASRILAECDYDVQRKIRANHVDFLAKEMELGTFVDTAQVVIAKQSSDGSRKIVNGRHTLSAIIRCGIPQKVIYVEKETADDNQTGRLYSSIDVNLSRTVSDQFSALRLCEELGFTPTQLKGLSAGIKFLEGKFTKISTGRRHMNEHSAKLAEYAPYMHAYLESTVPIPEEIYNAVHRAATVAVALVTYRFSATAYGTERIDDFWNIVIQGLFDSVDDPRRVAHRHLLNTAMHGGGMTARSKNSIVSPAYSSRVIANCFNAFVENRKLKSTVVSDPSSPIKINGSFFSGK